jgi:choline-sulfatase
MKEKRPNIVLIMSDEHAPQTLGCMGAGFARTPHIDRLAARGVVFENAYCNFALCVPSRASFMTGLLPFRIGAYDNGAPFSSRLATWAHMLARHGYRTVLDGRMHFIGPDSLHGFQEHVHEADYPIHGFRRGEEDPDRTAYRQWSEVRLIKSEGEYPVAALEVRRRDEALRFLDEEADKEPFCLTVGFTYPHYPHVCTEAAYALYEGVRLPAPVQRSALHPRNVHWSDNVWGFNRFEGQKVDGARRAYLAMVSMLDEWVGAIVDALEKKGLNENTVIIYTSDHGEMWGEHNLWGKNFFYEESARVPLIISAPSMGLGQGKRIATPVSLLDLYPTLRDIAAAESWDVPLDGRSLWQASGGNGELADVPIICEYYASDTRGPERMVRLQNYKLNYYHRQGTELFDLEKDPRELHDLSDDGGCESIKNHLLQIVMDGWDPDEVDAKVLKDQAMRALITPDEEIYHFHK